MARSVKENLSQFVGRVVKEKGLSYSRVAANAGGDITKGYVSGIISGQVGNITLGKLIALARGIGEDAGLLFAAYYGRPPRSAAALKDVTQWTAAELAAVIGRLVDNPRLMEILILADGLSDKSQARLVRSLEELRGAGEAEAKAVRRKRR